MVDSSLRLVVQRGRVALLVEGAVVVLVERLVGEGELGRAQQGLGVGDEGLGPRRRPR